MGMLCMGRRSYGSSSFPTTGQKQRSWIQNYCQNQILGRIKGRMRGCTLPPPPSTNDLLFSNITGILQIYIVHYMYDMYSQQLTLCYCIVKAFFFRFANKNCLRHQSVMPFLNGAAPPKKNLGSTTEIQLEVRMELDHGTDHGINFYCKSKALIARVKFQKQCGLETAT